MWRKRTFLQEKHTAGVSAARRYCFNRSNGNRFMQCSSATRVSTNDQETAAQVAALKRACCKRIDREKSSGGLWDRSELNWRAFWQLAGLESAMENSIQDPGLVASRAARRPCVGVENGLVTVTPFHVKPSCRSSDKRRRHPASAAPERMTASHILS